MVDGNETSSYLLLKKIKVVPQILVVLPQLFEHFLNCVLVIPHVQTQPNETLVVLHSVMQTADEAIKRVKVSL